MALNNGSSYLPTAGEGQVATWTGTYAATVVNNDDPLGVGRLQLNVPQVLGAAVSSWAVPSGSYYSIPNNGTTVSCVFIGGDPSQPAWNGPLDLSPIVESAAPPTVTYSTSAPPSPRVGDIWYDTLGGIQVAPQVWTYNSGTSTFSWVTQPSLGNVAIGAGQVQGSNGSGIINLAAGSITANDIHAGSLTGTVIGNLGLCLNKNPYFSGNSSTGWAVAGTSSTLAIVAASGLSPAAPLPGYAAYATWTASGAGNKLYASSDTFGIILGSRYLVSAWVYPTASTNINIGIEWRNSGTLVSSSTTANVVTAGQWNFITAICTAPTSGVTTGNVMMYSTSTTTSLYVQAAQAFPQVPGIVDATTITGATFIGTNWVENTHGSFLYSGTPAAGNLLASIAPASGNDAAWTSGSGNTYMAGTTSYFYTTGGTATYAVSIYQGTTSYNTWSGSAWVDVVAVGLGGSTAQLQFQAANVNPGYYGMWIDANVQFAAAINAVTGSASNPTVITTDTWHAPTMNTGFSSTAGSPVGYMLNPDNSVSLRGEITTTANNSSGATAFVIPYTPSQTQAFITPNNLSGQTGQGRVVFVNTVGDVGLDQSGTSGNFVLLDGIRVNLT